MPPWKATKPQYIYCPQCGDKAWILDNHEMHAQASNVDSVDIGGVFVMPDFISQEEEKKLIDQIDTIKPWVPSQEGRAKQDYGPKISFLKKKASVGDFEGFPRFAVDLFSRMQSTHRDRLGNFIPVEFCILDYSPERGSYIRPHYDDKWVWGDRLITVNILSETALRLTREFNIPPYEVVIRMPARSLVVIQGEARYDWHHSISRYDIKSRRVAMTWREFGDEILQDSEYKEFVDQVFNIATRSTT